MPTDVAVDPSAEADAGVGAQADAPPRKRRVRRLNWRRLVALSLNVVAWGFIIAGANGVGRWLR